MNIDNILFRCSSWGDLMGKSGLGVTGEKLAIRTYIEYKYGRTKEFTSKYTDKGNLNEPIAIKSINEHLQRDYVKNEIRISNDHITGECDVDSESEDLIIDVKNSWDIFTFMESMATVNKNYEWQGIGYMKLYGRSKFKLIHVLEDAPIDIVLRELERESYKHNGETPEYIQVQIISSLVYSRDEFDKIINYQGLGGDELADKMIDMFVEIPKTERISIRTFEFDEAKYKHGVSRVVEARNFLKNKYQPLIK
jgi:hypothetical protein